MAFTLNRNSSMGFFIKKSVNVGPLRFNLSKSGVGVSTGFKGFRIGTGPRGNYVQVGSNGIYYKKSFPITSDLKNIPNETPFLVDQNSSITHSEFKNNETSNLLTLHSAEYDDLVKELNSKASIPMYWLYGVIFLVIIDILYLYSGVSALITIIFNMLALAGIYYLFVITELKKSTVVMYDFSDANASKKYENLITSIKSMSTAQKKWLLQSKAEVFDSKYHAGAGHLVNRKLFSIGKDIDRYIKTNIEIYAVKLEHKIIFFFPDRLIIKRDGQYGIISYKNLNLDAISYRFIEDQAVPSDGKIVDKTWKYVNKKGGPDRRFKDNKQIPVLEYELLTMSSNSGLNEQLVFSRLGATMNFRQSISNLNK